MKKFFNDEQKITGNSIFKEEFLRRKYPHILRLINEFVIDNSWLESLPFNRKLYCFINNVKEKPKCDHKDCNNLPLFMSTIRGFRKYCSVECSKLYTANPQKNFKEKYGINSPMDLDVIKEKVKQTNLKKYGVVNVFQNEKIKDKIRETNLRKYGNEVASKSQVVKDTTKKSNMEKYGVESPAMLPSVKDKIKNIILEKYGVEYFTKSDRYLKSKEKYDIEQFKASIPPNLELKSMENGYTYTLTCLDCNEDFTINRTTYRGRLNIYNIPICTNCNPINIKDSFSQNEICGFINTLNVQYTKNDRSILTDGKEIDIYLPDYGVGIEYHGLYWHSEVYKDKDYHLNKTKLSENSNIHLIQIFEDEWLYKKDIVKSIIKNHLKLNTNTFYGRKCEVQKISTNVCKTFLNDNHIQGNINSKIRLGLFHNGELLSVMTFGGNRIALGSTNEVGEYEMLRFCNKLGTNVVGGASKLFKYFIKEYQPNKVTSYSDRRYFNGGLYKELGFMFNKLTQPNYYYIVGCVRENRYKYRKDRLVSDGYDKNMTEHEIMLDRGIYRIYDCGNKKWVWSTETNS